MMRGESWSLSFYLYDYYYEQKWLQEELNILHLCFQLGAEQKT
jgi:hypothetical protein